MAAAKHPAYRDACQQAARRAYDERESGRSDKGYNPPCFAVYFDGEKMFVRATTEDQPDDSVLICIAQHWNQNAVQLRFSGANSTWMDFWHNDGKGEMEDHPRRLA
jgi:hypothetical protein